MSKTHRKLLPPKPAARQPQARAVPAQASPPGSWQLELTIWVGLILATFVVYSEVGHFFFVTFDDPLYVTENAHVRSGLTLESIKWALTAVVDTNWIPVTMLSHLTASEFFGMQSGMHHWVNVVLHALSAVLLFAWFRRATSLIWPSAFVAFVFALHPLHVESVAWVSERKDVLSTFFWFLTIYSYLRYTEQPSVRRYLLVVAPFCLGLMAKPMLVTLPFVLLLLDVWPLARTHLPRTLIEKVPLFALSLIFSLVAYFVQHSGGAVQALPPADNIKNALISYVSYIGQTFWPVGLAMMYPPRQSPQLSLQAAGALAIILCVSVLAVSAWRTRAYVATGWFWYLGTLVPVIGLVQIGIQAHADRYMYVPMVGLSVVLAWGAADVVRKWPRAKSWVATAAVVSCLACLVVASAQAEYWRNSELLYEHAIRVTENNYVAEYSLGEYLMDIPGRGPDAIHHFEAALRIKPGSADAQNSIGAYFLQNGRDADAMTQFEAALRSNPDSAEAHFNMGLILEKNPDRIAEALVQFEAAVHARPEFARAQKSLGMLLLRLGRTTEALSHFEVSQRIQFDPEVERAVAGLRGVQR